MRLGFLNFLLNNLEKLKTQNNVLKEKKTKRQFLKTIVSLTMPIVNDSDFRYRSLTMGAAGNNEVHQQTNE